MKRRQLLAVLRAADGAMQTEMDAHLIMSRRSPPCRRGCSYCCFEQVYCSSDEAKLIANAIRARSAKAVAQVEKALKNWFRMATKELGGMDAVLSNTSKEAGAKTSMEYRAVHLPCPLLDLGTCSAYKVRPFSCRTHVSAEPDSSKCVEAYHGAEPAMALLNPANAVKLYSAAMASEAMKGGKLDTSKIPAQGLLPVLLARELKIDLEDLG